MAALSELAGHPDRCAPSIHIAGSKGKGSVTGMIASVLESAGYRAARYMSPHIGDFRERICLGNSFFDETVYCAAGDELRDLADNKVPASKNRLFDPEQGGEAPTFFELLTMYFFFCARAGSCDAMVVETGMGGRLDSTNILDPLVSIITLIELEHTAFLGSTLAEVAGEKAGIIKSGRPLILARQGSEALEVFRKRAAEKNSPLFYYPENVSLENLKVHQTGTDFTLKLQSKDAPHSCMRGVHTPTFQAKLDPHLPQGPGGAGGAGGGRGGGENFWDSPPEETREESLKLSVEQMLSGTQDLKTPHNPDTTKNPTQDKKPGSGSAGGLPQVFAAPAPPPRAARPTGDFNLSIPIPGVVQAENAALAVLALKTAFPEIDNDAIRRGLQQVKIPARFEKIVFPGGANIPLIIDGAHTPESAALCAETFCSLYGEGGMLLFACAADKNAEAMAQILLPRFSRIIVTMPGTFKISEPKKVYRAFSGNPSQPGKTFYVHDTGDAIRQTLDEAREKNLPVLCMGSFYLASEVWNYVMRNNESRTQKAN